MRGPIFANIVLADEINRAPPRTQAALLEAMQEHSVTAAGETMRLPEPFFVLATQNPIEQEGTYPLPEAQLDRFLFDMRIGYPGEDDEVVDSARDHGQRSGGARAGARRRRRDGRCSGSRARLPRRSRRCATRPRSRARRVRTCPDAPELVKRYVRWGAGPRAGQSLILGAKAHALLAGRFAVAPEDIKRVAHPVLRHRVLPNFAAEAEGITAEQVIDEILLAHPAAAERHRAVACPPRRATARCWTRCAE